MKRLELKGQVFGALVVIKRGPSLRGNVCWWCTCNCGRMSSLVRVGNLREGLSTGCILCRVDKHTIFGLGNSVFYHALHHHFQGKYHPRHKSHKYYKDMPFYPAWDSNQGGDLNEGAKWLRDNLGAKPLNHCLDVVDHEVGVWPGNLRWATINESNKNRRLFFRLSNEDFEKEARRRGYHLTKEVV